MNLVLEKIRRYYNTVVSHIVAPNLAAVVSTASIVSTVDTDDKYGAKRRRSKMWDKVLVTVIVAVATEVVKELTKDN